MSSPAQKPGQSFTAASQLAPTSISLEDRKQKAEIAIERLLTHIPSEELYTDLSQNLEALDLRHRLLCATAKKMFECVHFLPPASKASSYQSLVMKLTYFPKERDQLCLAICKQAAQQTHDPLLQFEIAATALRYADDKQIKSSIFAATKQYLPGAKNALSSKQKQAAEKVVVAEKSCNNPAGLPHQERQGYFSKLASANNALSAVAGDLSRLESFEDFYKAVLSP